MPTRCIHGERTQFEIENGIHRFNSLFILLQGEYEYIAGGVRRVVTPDQLVFFEKGVSFSKRVLRPIEFLLLSAEPFLYGGDPVLVFEEGDAVRLRGTIAHLKEAIASGKSDAVKEHFLNDILLTAKQNNPQKNTSLIQPVYKYIIENLSQKLTLSRLAQVGGCSEQTLIQRFKRYGGNTPMRYITALRINRAKELLSNTDFSVGQVAELCGFENVYYFSNAFKKETGISPLKFREQSLI